MAELLVRVVDKTNPTDVYLDTKLTKRGDVVCVMPDGWTWGKEELANPEWRIVKVPGVKPSDLSMLTTKQLPLSPVPTKQGRPLNVKNTLRARAFTLDLDHPAIATAGLTAFVTDHTVVPVAAPAGTDLSAIAITRVQPSNIETIQRGADGKVLLTPDGKNIVPPLLTPMETVITDYPLARLDKTTQDAVAGLNVTTLGAMVRKHCAATVDPALLTTIQVTKAYIDDPAIIGHPPNVIG